MAEDDSDMDMGLFSVPDIYADDIGAVHALGNENFRTVFFTWVQDPVSGVHTRVVVAKIVRPRSSVRPGGYLHKQLALALKRRPPGRKLDGH